MLNVNTTVLNANVDMMNDTNLLVLDLNMDNLYPDSLLIEPIQAYRQERRHFVQ